MSQLEFVRGGARRAGVLAVMLGAAASAQGAVQFSSTVGSLSATATFEAIGTDLLVTLTNDSMADVMVPADVLTALFFDVSGTPLTLTPASAVLSAGSSVLFDPQPAGGVVGGEWAYASGLAGVSGGTSYGISSAGYGVFGNANFPGPSLEPPTAVDGLQYGITSAGDNAATGNAAVTGGFPLIKHSVDFVLSGLPQHFDLSRIENVWFQYGTSLTEPHMPAPGAAGLLGAIGLLALRRRR